MKNFITSVLLCFLFVQHVQADMDPKSAKRTKKANELTLKYKFDDAEKIYRKILTKYPYYSTVWDAYSKMAAYRYAYHKSLDKRFTITVSKKDSSDSKSADSLAQALTSLLSGALSKTYQDKAIDIYSEATLKCEYSAYSSSLLRHTLFDKPVDEHVKDTAWYPFNKAERQFTRKNYAEAARLYQEAIALDSNFYSAKLYLGDAYYMLEDYVSAAKYFRNAIEESPTNIEPRKYLVDALANIRADEEAIEACTQALLIYPDVSLFLKLSDLLEKKNKEFDRKWMPREIMPGTDTKKITNTGNGPWKYYLEARLNFDTSYYDKKTGIIKANPITQQTYLEVYCWEQMLKNSPENLFTDARAMQQKGFLDCYVLFSLFHHATEPQFTHLSQNSRDHLRKYINLLYTSK